MVTLELARDQQGPTVIKWLVSIMTPVSRCTCSWLTCCAVRSGEAS